MFELCFWILGGGVSVAVLIALEVQERDILLSDTGDLIAVFLCGPMFAIIFFVMTVRENKNTVLIRRRGGGDARG